MNKNNFNNFSKKSEYILAHKIFYKKISNKKNFMTLTKYFFGQNVKQETCRFLQKRSSEK